TDERVMTQLEFEQRLADDDERIKNARSVVMIQCVGSRNEKRPYCSRVCCTTAIKNALEMKRLNPAADIYILFRDIRTYGLYEEHYRAACDAGIYFIRYDADNPPSVEARQEGLVVTVADAVLKRRLELEADVLVLSAAVEPHPDAANLAQIFKVAQDSDGFFREAHLKLRPVELGTDGVFVCGMAHYPKHIPEVVAQAAGAAGRVLALLAQEKIKVSGAVCVVEERRCIGCGACVAVCAYNAISLRKTKKGKKATVNPVLCKGDGLCNAVCPTGAITLKHFTDEQMNAQIETAFADFERVLSGLGAER
ncbi:MAG: heterodisulfide reductase, partial [Planctomycetota bacterium]